MVQHRHSNVVSQKITGWWDRRWVDN